MDEPKEASGRIFGVDSIYDSLKCPLGKDFLHLRHIPDKYHEIPTAAHTGMYDKLSSPCKFKHGVRRPSRLAEKPYTYVRSFWSETSSGNCCGLCPVDLMAPVSARLNCKCGATFCGYFIVSELVTGSVSVPLFAHIISTQNHCEHLFLQCTNDYSF